jgi:hypothetical protein
VNCEWGRGAGFATSPDPDWVCNVPTAGSAGRCTRCHCLRQDAAGRRAKCVLDIHALEANIPVRVPFWMFGGRGFPNGGESWPDWSQVAAYWLHPDDTLLPAWD